MTAISVIMPVYNVERYLHESMDSILGQTFGDFEFFCVDDGSTDASRKILEEYAAADSRVKILSTLHEGAYAARAKAFARATGAYVYFMDADDVLDRSAFESCYRLCEKENLDHLVFTAMNFVDGEGDQKHLMGLKSVYDKYYRLDDAVCDRIMPGRALMTALMDAGCFYEGPPLRFLRRAHLVENSFPLPHARFHGDSYYTPVSLYLSRRAEAVNRPYYRRRLRPGSITTSPGTALIHCESSLDVLLCLCRFDPFAADAAIPGSAAARYLARFVDAMCHKSQGAAPDDISRLAASLRGELPDSMKAFVGGCFLPLFVRCQGLMGAVRPPPPFVPTIRTCLAYCVKRLLERLRLLFSRRSVA